MPWPGSSCPKLCKAPTPSQACQAWPEMTDAGLCCKNLMCKRLYYVHPMKEMNSRIFPKREHQSALQGLRRQGSSVLHPILAGVTLIAFLLLVSACESRAESATNAAPAFRADWRWVKGAVFVPTKYVNEAQQ